MNKPTYLNSVLAIFFMLMVCLAVAHAYEHDNGQHDLEDCEICFILAQSTDDDWVDAIDQHDFISHRVHPSFSSKSLVSYALTHHQARAPPV